MEPIILNEKSDIYDNITELGKLYIKKNKDKSRGKDKILHNGNKNNK